jgi:8-oxo-dGTP diphosphatase
MKEPDNLATLLFVIHDNIILLIHKKRGLGCGFWNAPGGHVKDGEEPLVAALREFKEELRAEAIGVHEAGILDFHMPDEDFSMRVFVYRADAVKGELDETDEAIPCWFGVDALPWGEMWMDDRIWLPHVLKGWRVEGTFVMVDRSIRKCELRWT